MRKGNRSEVINGTNQCKVKLKLNKVVYLQTFGIIFFLCLIQVTLRETERERKRPPVLWKYWFMFIG